MSGGGRDAKRQNMSPGAAWVAQQVEQMQKQYTVRHPPHPFSHQDAVVAATMILNYQADCKAIGYTPKPPRRLQVRLETAWRNYDAMRRHVEWFIAQNVEYAAAPDKFAARRPLPFAPPVLPTPSPASALPAHMQTPAMVASPVPLSAASFLNSKPEPAFPEGLFNGDDGLAMMSMDDITAIISGGDISGGDFGEMGLGLDMMSNQNGQSGQDQSGSQNLTLNQAQPTTDQNPAMTPTSSILANLGRTSPAKEGQDGQEMQEGQEGQGQEGQPQQQQQPADQFDFNFGDGDVDLANLDLSGLEGLFGDPGDAPTEGGDLNALEAFLTEGDEGKKDAKDGGAVVPASEPAPAAEQKQPEPAPPQPQEPEPQPQTQPQPQAVESQPPPQPEPEASRPTDPPAQPTEPPAEPFETGDMGDFNFDEFNFGDDMPGVDGDEFASMLAEFK